MNSAQMRDLTEYCKAARQAPLLVEPLEPVLDLHETLMFVIEHPQLGFGESGRHERSGQNVNACRPCAPRKGVLRYALAQTESGLPARTRWRSRFQQFQFAGDSLWQSEYDCLAYTPITRASPKS